MNKHDNEKGFTLIEVLASIIILCAGLLMLLPMMIVSMQANDMAMDFSRSSMLIKEKMEELKSMTMPVSGSDIIETAQRVWTVADAEDDLKQFVVKITWIDKDGTTRTNTMVSYGMSQF